MDIPTPKLRHSFTLLVELGAPLELGPGRAGDRRIIPIIGGAALGPDITGEVLNLGADWQTIHADGAAHLDTRYAVKTNDGAVIEIVNVGTRHGPVAVIADLAAGKDVDPASYYMRTAARLETGDERYRWVNHMLFICAGIRRAAAVEIAYYAVK
jgi:hypothetical protein